MSLQSLFEIQTQLNQQTVEKHNLQGVDLLNKKFVALHTELGKMMNEQNSWKFWSKNQRPRTEIDVHCSVCQGTGDENYEVIQEDAEGIGGHQYIACVECNGTGLEGTKNPLLEEYVECFRFILSIGNSMGVEDLDCSTPYVSENTIELQYLSLVREITTLHHLWRLGMERPIDNYRAVFMQFVNLGGILGFTWNQIEQEYLKNSRLVVRRTEEAN